MIIIEKDKLLWQGRSIPEVVNNYSIDISKSKFEDSSESNVANTGGNIWHSLKNVLFEDNVSIKNIREKYW